MRVINWGGGTFYLFYLQSAYIWYLDIEYFVYVNIYLFATSLGTTVQLLVTSYQSPVTGHKLSIIMGKKGELGDSECGMVVCAKWAVLEYLRNCWSPVMFTYNRL